MTTYELIHFSVLCSLTEVFFLSPDVCELTLDANTAHKNLLLSEGNRKVTWVEAEQPYPDHKDRFDHHPLVLCEQGLDGRCYLEVEALQPFSIGLTYRTIGREGNVNDCRLGPLLVNHRGSDNTLQLLPSVHGAAPGTFTAVPCCFMIHLIVLCFTNLVADLFVALYS